MPRIDRRIAEAEGDPPLREFWRGVELRNREETDRIVERIVEEATPLSQIDF